MTVLYAHPYDITAAGFYFKSADEYEEKAANLRNTAGQPVEEFEIQFIDGESIDAQLFGALGITQTQISAFLDAAENWEERLKIYVIITVSEVGDPFDINDDDPSDLEVMLYQFETLAELAEHFVDEKMFGDIPKGIENYIDYEAIGRDLGMDFASIIVNGVKYFYDCC